MATHHLTIQKYEFLIRPQSDFSIPSFLGATLRGGFGYAFRDVTCALKRQECASCLLREHCAYVYVFETKPPEGASMMRLYPTIPHPFVFEPPDGLPNTTCAAGTLLSIGLLLIGRAIDLLPYFICAFRRLGQKGLSRQRVLFDLVEVRGIGPCGAQTVIYDDRMQRLSSFTDSHLFDLAQPVNTDCREVALALDSPLRLKDQGTLTDAIPFRALIANLLRRASALAHFHCGAGLGGLDFAGLVRQAGQVVTRESRLKWKDLERFSTRQRQTMKLGGVVGSIVYEGHLGPFMGILRFGEVAHAGKGTSFGLGKYRIVENPGRTEDSCESSRSQ